MVVKHIWMPGVLVIWLVLTSVVLGGAGQHVHIDKSPKVRPCEGVIASDTNQETCQCSQADLGSTFIKGENGEPGMPGVDAFDGTNGIAGPVGLKGKSGRCDISGPPSGPPGTKGDQGLPGDVGDPGDCICEINWDLEETQPVKGSKGIKGPRGTDGEVGKEGRRTWRGQIGQKGDKGKRGRNGSFNAAVAKPLSDMNALHSARNVKKMNAREKVYLISSWLTGEISTTLTSTEFEGTMWHVHINDSITLWVNVRYDEQSKISDVVRVTLYDSERKGHSNINTDIVPNDDIDEPCKCVLNSLKGAKGAPGLSGIPGWPGVKGPTGQKGSKGEMGTSRGIPGYVGDPGELGQKGPSTCNDTCEHKLMELYAGDPGDVGDPGSHGRPGRPSVSRGKRGIPGQRGQKGAPGISGLHSHGSCDAKVQVFSTVAQLHGRAIVDGFLIGDLGILLDKYHRATLWIKLDRWKPILL